MAVALHALPDHRPGGDIEGGEQRGRAMALIIMGHSAGAALLDRQPRLGAVECLDLALLVDAQHHRLVRRTQVEADDVLDFLDKSLVIRQLKTAHQMRLEPVCVPNPPHTGLAEADGLGHRPGAPLGCRRGLLVQGFVDHLRNHFGCQRRLPPGTAGVALEPGDPLRHVALLPAPHRRLALAHLPSNRHRPNTGPTAVRCAIARPISAAYYGPTANSPAAPDPQETARRISLCSYANYGTTPPKRESSVSPSTL